MTPSRRTLAVALVASMSVLFNTCGGSDKSPANPSSSVPPTTVPAGPPPPPPPDPPPGAASCSRIGLGTTASDCRKESPTFQDEVQGAINDLARDQPQLFESTELGLRVRSTGQFYVSVIERLDKKGLCAAFDGEEVGVKSDKTFNDQYQLITSKLIVRQGPSAYQATCYPAAFPLPLPPYPPNNGCPLPSSREIACAKETQTYYADIDAAISQVAREHPEVFDLNDVRGTEGGYRIVNHEGFSTYLIQAMQAKGFCARNDGEEFVFKKQNKFSEHYDLELAAGYVRRGEGTYESTCYPAAF